MAEDPQSLAWQPEPDRSASLFEALPDPAWVFDTRHLRFLEVNEAAVRAYGYSREEFLRMTLPDIRPPEDVPTLEAYLSRPLGSETRVWRHRRKDDTVIDVEVRHHEYWAGGQRARLAVARDVTERLRLERELQRSEYLHRALAESFPNGALILFDRDLRYTIADGTALERVGLSKEQLEGKTIYEAFPEETWRVLEPRYKATLEGEGSSWEMPYGGRFFLVSTHPARDELGNVFAGILMTQDITEAREARELLRKGKDDLEEQVTERTRELRKSLRDLQKSSEEREQLFSRLVRAQEDERTRIAADVHDDVIQQVAAAAIRLDMMGRDIPGLAGREDFRKVTEAVQASIGRLRHLMVELHPPALETDGLKAALAMLLTAWEDDPRTGGRWHLRVEVAQEPSPDVRTVLYRVAQEAIANAAKHAGAANLEVRLTQEPNGLRLQVSDDGRGFDPKPVLRAGAEGGHIGLVSMRERAESAGGWLMFESSLGQGTTVSCWLPS